MACGGTRCKVAARTTQGVLPVDQSNILHLSLSDLSQVSLQYQAIVQPSRAYKLLPINRLLVKLSHHYQSN